MNIMFVLFHFFVLKMQTDYRPFLKVLLYYENRFCILISLKGYVSYGCSKKIAMNSHFILDFRLLWVLHYHKSLFFVSRQPANNSLHNLNVIFRKVRLLRSCHDGSDKNIIRNKWGGIRIINSELFSAQDVDKGSL